MGRRGKDETINSIFPDLVLVRIFSNKWSAALRYQIHLGPWSWEHGSLYIPRCNRQRRLYRLLAPRPTTAAAAAAWEVVSACLITHHPHQLITRWLQPRAGKVGMTRRACLVINPEPWLQFRTARYIITKVGTPCKFLFHRSRRCDRCEVNVWGAQSFLSLHSRPSRGPDFAGFLC